MTLRESIPGLVVFLLICLSVNVLATQLTSPYLSEWYNELNKPAWTPPNAVFAPVWTALYVTMALAAWLAWHRGRLAPTAPPLLLFFLQLALTALWAAFFFAHQQPGLAFFEILLLWCALLATLVSFWRIERLAGVLLVPALVWVAFAAALNYAIWRMN
jgi:tryptophan-rich sensory protein